METKITYMTYYAACGLLTEVSDFLYYSDYPPVPPVREILKIAHKEAMSFEDVAIKALVRRESRLVADIEDAISPLSKALKSYRSRASESCGDGTDISIDEVNLRQEVHSFAERVKTMEAKMNEYDADGKKSKMVGFSDLYEHLASRVAANWGLMPDPSVRYAISGMAGIGKTALAKEFFDDRLSFGIDFDCRAWVTVGPNPQLKEIILSILDQVNPYSDEMLMEGDENISEYLKDSLSGRRYLIVLDDVWDEWLAKEMKCLLSKNHENCLVLLTTRLQEIAQTFDYNIIKMRFLDKEESWNLLREKVFGEEPCPFQLEKFGKKIAEHCDGLPLTIVTVADLLSKAEKTWQNWDELAAKKNHQFFKDAYNEISEVLLPSYENLTQILQMCFLYMGVFPQNYKIPRSKLICMWCTDGFFERMVDKLSNDDARECLHKLVSNSLVVIYESTIYKNPFTGKTEIKTCRLHSSFWHLSNILAGKIKFFHVLNSPNDGLEEGIEKQRRLSFHNNILLGIKDVYKSVEDNCASTTHSLLFYGPYHRYQVPICFRLKLLKQLDALTIRFYEFPMEILQLVLLRYLAVTVNGKLPASISQLSNLQVLIVSRHMSIKSYRAPSYLPVEIWNMKELQHLQVMGCDLPYPPSGASLESLLILANVSPLSCTEGILRAIPNLKKLGIRIDLAPYDDGKRLSCFDYIFHSIGLETLKIVVENPEFAVTFTPLTIFSSCLQSLSLSGLGYSWEETSKFSSLPRLAVLKLRNYAFRGPKWVVKEKGFGSLCSFVIEDTDLEEWEIGSESFPMLTFLSIKCCYKLEKILGEFGKRVVRFELADCNPLGVEQVKKSRNSWANVDVIFSWNDGN